MWYFWILAILCALVLCWAFVQVIAKQYRVMDDIYLKWEWEKHSHEDTSLQNWSGSCVRKLFLFYVLFAVTAVSHWILSDSVYKVVAFISIIFMLAMALLGLGGTINSKKILSSIERSEQYKYSPYVKVRRSSYLLQIVLLVLFYVFFNFAVHPIT